MADIVTETGRLTHPARTQYARGVSRAIELFPPLKHYVQDVLGQFERIGPERRERLEELAAFVRERAAKEALAPMTFICTHNSRRSHISQLWAATAAAFYGHDHVRTYSGGTEATAFNPRAVAAMERAGFAIENPGGENPRYRVRFADNAPPEECFSKVYDDPANPAQGYAAVMTCSQANEACPVVTGAAIRVAVPWEDPKVADDTPEEAARYDERARQIAGEMFYLFSRV